jgi:signal transduction histidine kinase
MITERLALQQVFMNLIGNAIKYTQVDAARIEIAVDDAGAFYEFSVADNGPGIPREFHEKIWVIFQTLEPRDRVEGTGIGLALVKKIVETRGGRVWLDSRPGSGTTFRLHWPKFAPREDWA